MIAITRRHLVFTGLALFSASVTVRGMADKPAEVKLVKVKYDAFLKQVASNKTAKLTMVDAWATWCGPCKDNFPHVVEMHAKYARKGLVVASLCMDDTEKPAKVAEATEFLKQSKATFTNYLLDETLDDGFEKFDLTSIPAVFLYGPDGKLIKRFTGADPNNLFTYEQVEEFVKNYLEGKTK